MATCSRLKGGEERGEKTQDNHMERAEPACRHHSCSITTREVQGVQGVQVKNLFSERVAR